MSAKILSWLLVTLFLTTVVPAQAQQAKKIPRVGVITSGGLWYTTIDGLRAGLKQLGLEEGKQFVLAIQETKGDAKAAEEACKIRGQDS